MKQKDSFTQRSNTLGYILRSPYQRLSNTLYRSLAAFGYADIRPSHSAVFRYIGPSGNRVTDLAEMAEMTKQSMGYLVDTLERSGYVRLDPDPNDGRAKLAKLTPKGNRVLKVLLDESNRLETELARVFGPEFVVMLRQNLLRLDEFLEIQAPQ